MCKSADRAMVIGELALWEKTGGRSGVYRRDVADSTPLGLSTSTADDAADGTADGTADGPGT
jgi:hypothetical protein